MCGTPLHRGQLLPVFTYRGLNTGQEHATPSRSGDGLDKVKARACRRRARRPPAPPSTRVPDTHASHRPTSGLGTACRPRLPRPRDRSHARLLPQLLPAQPDTALTFPMLSAVGEGATPSRGPWSPSRGGAATASCPQPLPQCPAPSLGSDTERNRAAGFAGPTGCAA